MSNPNGTEFIRYFFGEDLAAKLHHHTEYLHINYQLDHHNGIKLAQEHVQQATKAELNAPKLPEGVEISEWTDSKILIEHDAATIRITKDDITHFHPQTVYDDPENLQILIAMLQYANHHFNRLRYKTPVKMA